MNEVFEHSVWSPTHHATHPRPPYPTATSNKKQYYTITTGVPEAMVHCWESAADDLATAMLQGALMGSRVTVDLSAQQQQQQQQEEEEEEEEEGKAFCRLEGLRSTVVPVSTHPQCMTLAQLLEQAEMSRTVTSGADFYDYGTHAVASSKRNTTSDSSGNCSTSSTSTNSMPSTGPATLANRAVGSARVSLTLSDGTRVSSSVFRAPSSDATPAAFTAAEKDMWVGPVTPAEENDNRDSEAAVTAATLTKGNVTGNDGPVKSANAASASARTVTAAVAAAADRAVQSPIVGNRPRVRRCVGKTTTSSLSTAAAAAAAGGGGLFTNYGPPVVNAAHPAVEGFLQDSHASKQTKQSGMHSRIRDTDSHVCNSGIGQCTTNKLKIQNAQWLPEPTLPQHSGIKRQHSNSISADEGNTADGWNAAPSKRHSTAALAPQQDGTVGTAGIHVSQLDEPWQQQNQQLKQKEQQQHFDTAKHNDECPDTFSELVCDDLSDMLLDSDLSDMLLDSELSSFTVQQHPHQDQIQHESRLTTRGTAFSDDGFLDIWGYLTATESSAAGGASSAAAAAAMFGKQAAWEPKQLLAVDGLLL